MFIRFLSFLFLISFSFVSLAEDGVVIVKDGTALPNDINFRDALVVIKNNYLAARDRQKENPSAYIAAANNLAAIYSRSGDPQKALELSIEALKFGTTNQVDSFELANSYNNVARLSVVFSDYSKEDLYFRAIELFEKQPNPNSISHSNTLYNIGMAYERKNDLNAALSYYIDSLDMTDTVLGSDHQLTIEAYEKVLQIKERIEEFPVF